MANLLKIFSLFILLFCNEKSVGQIGVKSTVTAATVYDKGAKVTRQATINIPAGESEINLVNLYPNIDENSIQLKFSEEDVQLVDIRFTQNYINPPKPDAELKLIRDTFNLIGYQKTLIDKRIEVLKGEESVIKSNTNLTGKSSDLVTDLKGMTEFYRERVLEILEEIMELQREKNELQKLSNRYQQQLNYVNSRGRSYGELKCKLITKSPISTKVELSYFFKDAYWKPTYEIRSTGVDAPISLIYKASISQSTGHTWDNIPLTLSNARPVVNNTMPELSPIYASSFPLEDIVTMDTVIAFEPETYEEQIEIVQNEEKWSETLKTQTSTQFKLDLLQTIRGDRVAQNIIVKELEIAADYQYFVVPGKSNLAYLLAQIPEYSQYNLLPGNANLFFEKTYLGKSYIDSQTTSDTLNLSLGIDYDVVVERNRKTFSAPKFIGNTVKETIDFEIKIRNNKSEAITINVLDQIPVSTEKAIEIKLVNKDGANFEEETGKLKWKITIPANTTETLDFSYQLKHPKNVRVAGKW